MLHLLKQVQAIKNLGRIGALESAFNEIKAGVVQITEGHLTELSFLNIDNKVRQVQPSHKKADDNPRQHEST